VCSVHAPLESAVDTSVAVVKRLNRIATVEHQHELVPILNPRLDSLPLAMSLEWACGSQPTFCPKPKADSKCPMCEVLYVLQGAGQVMVDGAATAEVLRSGDSILAPVGCIQVLAQVDKAHGNLVSSSCQQAGITFLRVVLPLHFALGEQSTTAEVAKCSCAAGEV
jgi:hypothetical protein